MATTRAITATEKFKTGLKRKFSVVFFSIGLETCTKAKVKFEVKGNATPEFKPKKSVPFAAFDPINKELERLEKLGVIYKVEYSEWASLTVYVKKKKNNKIRVWANTGRRRLFETTINHHHHHVVLLARISLTLSRHFSLTLIASGRSSGLHPVFSHSCCMYV